MTKNPPSPKSGLISAGAKPGPSAAVAPDAAGNRWKGDAVEESAVADRSESPEEAANRAEGNAPVAAEQAVHANAAPPTFALKHPPHPSAALEDEAARHENEEEKRQSAVEEHAAESPKHSPHGRL